jgi:hypothetical protein
LYKNKNRLEIRYIPKQRQKNLCKRIKLKETKEKREKTELGTPLLICSVTALPVYHHK